MFANLADRNPMFKKQQFLSLPLNDVPASIMRVKRPQAPVYGSEALRLAENSVGDCDTTCRQ